MESVGELSVARTAKHDIPDIALHPAARAGADPVPERIEQTTGVILPDRQEISVAVHSKIAVGGGVDHEISPDSDRMVFVIAVSAVRQRETDLPSTVVPSQRWITECEIAVPDLNL